jgi:hypothetical protein
LAHGATFRPPAGTYEKHISGTLIRPMYASAAEIFRPSKFGPRSSTRTDVLPVMVPPVVGAGRKMFGNWMFSGNTA